MQEVGDDLTICVLKLLTRVITRSSSGNISLVKVEINFFCHVTKDSCNFKDG